MKKNLLFAALFIFSGSLCYADPIWVKPDASKSDFAHDQDVCIRRAQPAKSNSFGPKSADPILFSDCMHQSGWHLQDESRATQPAPGPMQKTLESLRQEKEKRCTSDEFRPFFSKTACDPQDITPGQMADKTTITAEEKKVLLKLKKEMQKSQDKATTAYREYGEEQGDKIARLLESWQVFSDKNVSDLLQKKQSWGNYNRYRKDLYSQLNAELQKISRPHSDA